MDTATLFSLDVNSNVNISSLYATTRTREYRSAIIRPTLLCKSLIAAFALRFWCPDLIPRGENTVCRRLCRCITQSTADSRSYFDDHVLNFEFIYFSLNKMARINNCRITYPAIIDRSDFINAMIFFSVLAIQFEQFFLYVSYKKIFLYECKYIRSHRTYIGDSKITFLTNLWFKLTWYRINYWPVWEPSLGSFQRKERKVHLPGILMGA